MDGNYEKGFRNMSLSRLIEKPVFTLSVMCVCVFRRVQKSGSFAHELLCEYLLFEYFLSFHFRAAQNGQTYSRAHSRGLRSTRTFLVGKFVRFGRNMHEHVSEEKRRKNAREQFYTILEIDVSVPLTVDSN